MSRANNFNLLRMLAAVAVIVSHSYPLSLGRGAREPLQDYLGGPSLGALAVYTFFAISGYLLTQSFHRSNLVTFIGARMLRLLPALLVVSLIVAFVLGPTFSNAANYFGMPEVWAYVPLSLTFPAITAPIPSLFEQVPYSNTVNGPLYTLHYEVVCQIGLVFAMLAFRKAFAFFLIGFLGLYSMFDSLYMILGLAFVFGASLAHYKHQFKFEVAVVLAAVFLASKAVDIGTQTTLVLALSYIALWFANQTTPWLRSYNRLGDYSYGVYISAWPIQQILATTGPIHPVQMMVAAIPLSVMYGMFSWHLIERPSLQQNKKWRAIVARVLPEGLSGLIKSAPRSNSIDVSDRS